MDEPILMQCQQFPFNGDDNVEKVFLHWKEKFNIENVVETGTCLGYSTKFFCENFKNVITIEVNSKYLDIAIANRLRNFDNINPVLGDSSKDLYPLIKDLKGNTVFFLDAHWQNHCPLKEELAQIKQAGIKPCIAIHDFKVPNKDFGFDSYNGQPFTYEWLKADIDAVYGEGNYRVQYPVVTKGANRGLIYLSPKI